jgi:hypothetical protein
MHTIEIRDAKIKRYIPSDLSECDAQYIDMWIDISFSEWHHYDEFSYSCYLQATEMKPSKR